MTLRPSGIAAASRAYAELLRPPNLATAAADVLAGYAAAGLGDSRALGWLLAAAVCLYGGGITLNDFFDRELDAVERPERPIPSGRVRPAAAATVGITLLIAGVGAAFQANSAAGWIAAAIAGFVLLYDSWGKHRAAFGPVNMGLCRGLNLLLGVAAVPAALAGRWVLALLPFTYICGVTALSRGEVSGGKRGTALFSLLSMTLVLVGLTLTAMNAQELPWAGLALTVALAWRLLPPFWRAYKDSAAGPIRAAVKTGVLSLVLLDAVIGASYAGVLFGGVILATALLAALLSRAFAVT